MQEMTMGSNVALSATRLRATLRWTAGPGVPDVDASALLLDERGVVGSEADFVFYNQPRHPSGAVLVAGATPGADAVDVDLTRVPAAVTRIVIAASASGGPFGAVPDLRLELADGATGAAVAAFAMRAGDETAFVSAEIYRRGEQWKFRAVGQGYASGLAGLATDFGIDVAGADGADAATGGSAAPSAPAAPAPAAPPPAPVTPAPDGRRADRDPGYDPLLDLG